ncbi:hypothetical protein [Sphingobium algorifonticola]|uniref:Uncharacterized protein n=1 Tax=Sphingobium algorifonticola TaxID=2008318 RepID=A0A437J8M1_9SPHN|nr:hypothetical protein [Sphingobium algorifonticola]RVT41720.1 hypothetical protein ENE74_05370 [Sphingobium algorifonticola]
MTLLLLLALQATSPETDAVMARSRREAAAARQAALPTPVLPLAPETAAKLQNCLDSAMADPEAGIRAANAWRMAGGSFHARQCLGFSYAKADRWAPALVAFEQAAEEAERANDSASSARLWAQAGNAALAGGDAAKARDCFDAALARGMPDGLAKGEAYLDRARARVALNDLAGARQDMDSALDFASQDPLAWLLSATLARRTGEMPLAQAHIARAVQMAPDDASVALEEGNIAILTDHTDVARAAWQRAVRIAGRNGAGQNGVGKAAADSLARLDARP